MKVLSASVGGVHRAPDGIHLHCARCDTFQRLLEAPTYRCADCDLIWIHEMERREAKNTRRAIDIVLFVIVLALMYGLAAANCFSGST